MAGDQPNQVDAQRASERDHRIDSNRAAARAAFYSAHIPAGKAGAELELVLLQSASLTDNPDASCDCAGQFREARRLVAGAFSGLQVFANGKGYVSSHVGKSAHAVTCQKTGQLSSKGRFHVSISTVEDKPVTTSVFICGRKRGPGGNCESCGRSAAATCQHSVKRRGSTETSECGRRVCKGCAIEMDGVVCCPAHARMLGARA